SPKRSNGIRQPRPSASALGQLSPGRAALSSRDGDIANQTWFGPSKHCHGEEKLFVLNKDDQRIVKEKDVAESLDSEANLAAMPWDDFEHLVRQLFEWEFGRNGVEVKVTRASRDRGVDAIMFDPDPLRGGKYVLQAKRNHARSMLRQLETFTARSLTKGRIGG